jgi:hypothetical protein
MKKIQQNKQLKVLWIGASLIVLVATVCFLSSCSNTHNGLPIYHGP